MAYQIIPNLRYLGYQAYYKISDEKEPATPIATATAVSDNSNLLSVDAYPVYNSNSNNSYSNSSYRSSYIPDTEIPGTINYSDGDHLVEVPYPTGPITENDIRLIFFQQNPTKIIYRRLRIGGDKFVPIGHFVSNQLVRGQYEYRFSSDTHRYTDSSILYYDPTSSGGNKRKSYRRRRVSSKGKSRRSRK